jgi:hypothetical protein
MLSVKVDEIYGESHEEGMNGLTRNDPHSFPTFEAHSSKKPL